MDTTDTLDLMVCGNPLIIPTDYKSLEAARTALQNALERVTAELDYIDNQPVKGDAHTLTLADHRMESR